MVPNVAKAGTSFKGAFAYYLHDKRQEGESVRDTSERVGWTETRNLATRDPELAARIMAATAIDQERLKREAGIKNTGRKSANSVYAYSLAWHPDEAGKIGKAEMLRAADESLQAIGAAGRQAVIVAHTDEPHPHVHVIVNRVSMEDGRMPRKPRRSSARRPVRRSISCAVRNQPRAALPTTSRKPEPPMTTAPTSSAIVRPSLMPA